MRIVQLDHQNVEEAGRLADAVFSYSGAPFPSEIFRAGLDPVLFSTYSEKYRTIRIMSWVVIGDAPNEVMATISMYELADDYPDSLWIACFCVAPTARGQGIGSLLLNFATELAQLLGKRFIRLYTSAHRKERDAQILYEKNGFAVVVSRMNLPGRSLLFREKTLDGEKQQRESSPAFAEQSASPPASGFPRVLKPQQNFLRKLKRLTIEDQPLFSEYIAAAGNTSWVSFFPFLLGFSGTKGRTLYWEEMQGYLCLYYLAERQHKSELSLYLPPIPFDPIILAAAANKITGFNNNPTARITWVEEKDKAQLEGLGFTLDVIENEHHYRSDCLHRFHRKYRVKESISIRDFTPEDRESCFNLLQRWRDDEFKKGINRTGWYYKSSCLENSSSFTPGSVIGKVLVVDNQIRGLSFAGPVSPSVMSSLFTAMDPAYREGANFLLSGMAEADSSIFWNTSAEDDDSGKRLHELVTEHEIHPLYRARKRFRSID